MLSIYSNPPLDEVQFLDDIANAAVQDLVVPVSPPAAVPVISCVCGSALEKTTPVEAYHSLSVKVECDVCGQSVGSSDAIYHCPQKGNSAAHSGGYDVCAPCLELQCHGFVGVQPKQQPVPVPDEVP